MAKKYIERKYLCIIIYLNIKNIYILPNIYYIKQTNK